MSSERLRYTGNQPRNFLTGNVGAVQPGGEFDVDASLLRRFLCRPDVEHAGQCPDPPCRCGQEPVRGPESPAEPTGETAPGNTPPARRGKAKDAPPAA